MCHPKIRKYNTNILDIVIHQMQIQLNPEYCLSLGCILKKSLNVDLCLIGYRTTKLRKCRSCCCGMSSRANRYNMRLVYLLYKVCKVRQTLHIMHSSKLLP